ncbi:LacI family DNA-binding transcriptional regulator [Clostridium sp.]
MASIRDVAKVAGVSIATVSRILNQDESYKTTETTKRKVWNAVNELNYIQHNSTKNISKKYRKPDSSSIKIGCILSVTKEKYTDPYFMSILSGIDTALNENGYNLTLIRTYKELEDEKILYDTLNNSLTGLIIMESLESKIYEIIKKNVPFIVGIDTEDPTIDNIGYDRYQSAMQAMNFLIEKGHKRIAFLGSATGSSNIFNKEGRYQGYINSLKDADIEVDETLIKDCQWSRSICFEKTKELLTNPNPPTAIFIASDTMATIALTAIYDSCLRVPDDIAIISISNIEMSSYTSPPLTTIDVPKQEIGRLAATTLIARINGDTTLPKRILLPTSIIKRDSV